MDWLKTHEWLNLLFRWFHIVVGITWIGQVYLFNWMEKTLPKEIDPNAGENVAGQLWMVHGGGFYFVEKQKIPKLMPRSLHWFKWESALTWISGLLLLIIVYYMGGLMVEADSELAESTASYIGAGVLFLGYVIYHFLWSSPLGKNEIVGAILSFILTLALFVGLDTIFSSRAAMMHIGATFGTIMTANVWMTILPAQRKMIASAEKGETPDLSLASKARRCSKHNTYMSIPLIFIMISNHFPTVTYGNDYNWLIIGVLILAGWLATKWMRG